LKKRSKKLLFAWRAGVTHRAPRRKVFLLLFLQKKKALLPDVDLKAA
jgi:hypothetical protein